MESAGRKSAKGFKKKEIEIEIEIEIDREIDREIERYHIVPLKGSCARS